MISVQLQGRTFSSCSSYVCGNTLDHIVCLNDSPHWTANSCGAKASRESTALRCRLIVIASSHGGGSQVALVKRLLVTLEHGESAKNRVHLDQDGVRRV